MYGYSSSLTYLQGSSSIVIPSQEGVHQGDPLGPVLFATTIHPILSEIQNNIPEATLLAYLDDVFLLGSPDKVLVSFNMLKNLFQPSICLSLKPSVKFSVPMLLISLALTEFL